MTPPRRLLALGALLLPGAMPALANDPSFRLTNNSPAAMNEVYVSSSRQQNWGPDRLGEGTLSPGNSYVIRLPAGQCTNDVRVVYANGRS